MPPAIASDSKIRARKRPPPAGYDAGRVALTLAGRRRPALSAFFRAAAAASSDSDSDSEAAAPRRRPRPARPRAPAEVRTWVTDAGGRRHSSRLASPKAAVKKKAPSPRRAPARRRAAQVPCTHGCGRSFATPQDMRQHARNDCPARPAAALSEEDEPEEDDAALSALTESELRRVMARRGVGAAAPAPPAIEASADGADASCDGAAAAGDGACPRGNAPSAMVRREVEAPCNQSLHKTTIPSLN